MHEMSIALNILNIAVESAAKEKATQINQIEIAVGRLSGVLVDSLEFCFDVAKRDTIAHQAELKIIDIAGKGECLSCETEINIESLFAPCPSCAGINIDIMQGKELSIKSINVD
jgi:hydrogenase nickel incorporation protein HypA/HybF